MPKTFFFNITKVYLGNGFRLVLVDRIILFIDIFLATGLTFLMQAMLWKYIYKDSGHAIIEGKTFTEIMMYYIFVISMNRFNNGYGIIEDISYLIYTGKIELTLTKPVSFKIQKLFEYVGGSLVYLPLAFFPLILKITFFNDQTAIENISFVLGHTVLLIMSQILCFLLAFFISMITFKAGNTEAVLAVYSTTMAFLGGVLLPANYWPENMQFLMQYNPFAFTMGAISEFALSPSVQGFFYCCLGIGIYILFFNLICNYFWKRLTKDYKGLGG